MQESEILAMGERERSYWWHVCRRLVWRSILDKWLPADHNYVEPSVIASNSEAISADQIATGYRPRNDNLWDRMTERGQILDIGCGTGFNLSFLKNWGEVMGIDQSEVAISSAQLYGVAKQGDVLRLPVPDLTIDLATAFDVLEHVADDEVALLEWARVIKIGGYLAISVPAYQWLFGPHDRALSHQRRYNTAELSAKLTRAGLKPVFASYVFMFTFPVFIAQRLLAKTLGRDAGYNPAPGIVNQLLIWLGQLEAVLVKWISLPFGSSVFILSKKI